MSRIGIQTTIVLLFLAVILTGCGPIIVIQPFEVGVVYNLTTGELEDPIGPGTHVVNPLEEVTIYPTGQQEYTIADRIDANGVPVNDAIVARTTDGQELRIDISVIYHLDPEQINMIHIRWRDRYPDDFIRPTVRFVVRDMTATVDAHGLFADFEGRVDYEDEIQSELETRFSAEGIILERSLIRAINFTPEFAGTMEAQAVATQNANLDITATPVP